jgi:hypothetical protein
MNLAMTGIDHQPLAVRLVNEDFEQRFPQSLVTPTAEASVCVFPVAIVRGQVSPRSAGAQYPKYGVEKGAIVAGNATPDASSPRQVRFK